MDLEYFDRSFLLEQFREFYGAAETSFITLADETTPDTSVGRPYPGVDLHLDPTGEDALRMTLEDEVGRALVFVEQ